MATIFRSIYDAVDAAIQSYSLPKGGHPFSIAARVLVDNNGNVISVSDSAGNPILNAIPRFSTQDALTALAGGGQPGATAITTSIARFTVVATAADSSILPSALVGMEITVINSGAASMNVFPATGETIDAGAANAARAVANGKSATFYCAVAGKWHSILTA